MTRSAGSVVVSAISQVYEVDASRRPDHEADRQEQPAGVGQAVDDPADPAPRQDPRQEGPRRRPPGAEARPVRTSGRGHGPGDSIGGGGGGGPPGPPGACERFFKLPYTKRGKGPANLP